MAMRAVIMGAPGAGKGTQAKLFEERRGVAHISTGDMLRDARRAGTVLGCEAERYMAQGLLVPDDVVIGIVADRMAAQNHSGGFLLDGFPRTVRQAEALDTILGERGQRLDAVVSINVPEDELVRRLAGRRICRQCGAVYQLNIDPAARAGRCDRCGGELDQREDDREETVRARFEIYARDTAPVLHYYRDAGLLREVPGTGTREEIFLRMAAMLP